MLTSHAKNIKKLLTQTITASYTNTGTKILLDAMLYASVIGSGKFVRSFLVTEVAKMLVVKDVEDIVKTALSIELVHSYTLVHDDMPCMDNSVERRGHPSLHVKYGESTALLAGNSLLTKAFEVLTTLQNTSVIPKVILLLCEASGAFGVMAGQVLDLDENLKKTEFEEMNLLKTGKLFEFCIIAPTLFATITEEQLNALKRYAKIIGASYQMIDDVLDEGEESHSYTSIYKKEELQAKLKQMEGEALQILLQFKNNEVMVDFTKMIFARSY